MGYRILHLEHHRRVQGTWSSDLILRTASPEATKILKIYYLVIKGPRRFFFKEERDTGKNSFPGDFATSCFNGHCRTRDLLNQGGNLLSGPQQKDCPTQCKLYLCWFFFFSLEVFIFFFFFKLWPRVITTLIIVKILREAATGQVADFRASSIFTTILSFVFLLQFHKETGAWQSWVTFSKSQS